MAGMNLQWWEHWPRIAVALPTLTFAAAVAFGAPPASALNPAVTQDDLNATICTPGFAKRIRPPVVFTSQMKRDLLREAGLPKLAASQYQLDHVVPIEVGGAPRARDNLALQPLAAAKRKDQLEHALHRDVCGGRVSLADAQTRLWEWSATTMGRSEDRLP